MEKYDICVISVPEDAEAANILADSIRRYRLPRGVVLPDPSLDYRRIYVDSSGSDFTNEVRELLDSSRYMIIICTPRTKYSQAINMRLAYFRKVRRNEEIVIVIAEAEPIDSFPESIIEKKTVRHIMPDMSIVERIETVEPVAADIRGDTPKRRKQLLRYETVRITASVLGLHPDALEQRHRRRRSRSILMAASVVSAVLLVASGIFIRLGLIARDEGIIAEKQTELSIAAAERLVVQLPEVFADDPQALEYINDAIEEAGSALDSVETASAESGD